MIEEMIRLCEEKLKWIQHQIEKWDDDHARQFKQRVEGNLALLRRGIVDEGLWVWQIYHQRKAGWFVNIHGSV